HLPPLPTLHPLHVHSRVLGLEGDIGKILSVRRPRGRHEREARLEHQVLVRPVGIRNDQLEVLLGRGALDRNVRDAGRECPTHPAPFQLPAAISSARVGVAGIRARVSARKRPLPSRSCCTTAATSRPPSAGAEGAKGTIAIGTGSRTPEVTSISSAALAGRGAPGASASSASSATARAVPRGSRRGTESGTGR